MPATEKENDRIHIDSESRITVKSYGLPMIFWFYLAAILVVLFVMFLAIKGPLFKVITSDDGINQIIGVTLASFMVLLPVSLLAFFFYEKWIEKKGNQLKVIHRFFFLPVFSKTYPLKTSDSFEVLHFLDGENMARIHKDENMRAFQNQGHFHLYLETDTNKKFLLDRHSRRADLNKLKDLLSRY